LSRETRRGSCGPARGEGKQVVGSKTTPKLAGNQGHPITNEFSRNNGRKGYIYAIFNLIAGKSREEKKVANRCEDRAKLLLVFSTRSQKKNDGKAAFRKGKERARSASAFKTK